MLSHNKKTLTTMQNAAAAPGEAAASTDPSSQPPAEEADAAPPKEDWEVQRDHHKSAADAAFRSRDYGTAIVQYTNALSVDPTNAILLSNRSAAHLANGEKSKSLSDARECIKVSEGKFVKGHSRLAAAMASLGRWAEARAAYGTVLSTDPNNQAAKKGVEDCRERELAANRAEVERLKRIREEREAREKAEKEEAEAKAKAEQEEQAKSGGDGGGGDDLLDDFFADVESATTSSKKKKDEGEADEAKSKEEKDSNNESKEDVSSNDQGGEDDESKQKNIQIQLSDLGSSEEQINRLLAPNHEWKNLNPYAVLAVPHDVPAELLSRRYKALSLLLHPDKCPDPRTKDAFEYVRRAMQSLSDEAKANHTKALIEQGLKQGRKDYTGTDPKELQRVQDKAVMKIFAEIERSRREVEKRKRNQEKRERDQEDAEVAKVKAEMKFNKNWKQEDRVEKRIGNWRDFQTGPSNNKKQKKG